VEHVEACGTRIHHCLLHVRKLGLEQQSHARHEVVRLAELSNAFAVPSLPTFIDGARKGNVVLFENGYIMTIPGKK
jgi:hypothetical protein